MTYQQARWCDVLFKRPCGGQEVLNIGAKVRIFEFSIGVTKTGEIKTQYSNASGGQCARDALCRWDVF
jgi:hypothetical protein